MMEPRAEIKNRMGDRWRQFGYKILKQIILTWNHGFAVRVAWFVGLSVRLSVCRFVSLSQ